jgi:hypothetical protein
MYDLPMFIWPRRMFSSWIMWGLILTTISNREYDQETPVSSPFHPRLYLQFGLRDYMSNVWVLKPENFPFELQEFDWHWDTTSGQLKRGNHPPWYNGAGLESGSEHDLEQDADDMPMKRDPKI